MKCKWENKEGKNKCNRELFGDSEYCLFHKPNKNSEESLIFWAVINLDPFCNIRGDLRKVFYQNITFDTGENFDFETCTSILKYFIKTGVVTFNIAEPFKSVLEADISNSINSYLQNSGINPAYHTTIIEQWKISGLHGSHSGYFTGFIFPAGGYFDYKYFRLNQVNSFMFDYVIFEKQCWFENYNFGKNDVHFINTQINREVSFENAVFDGCVYFTKTNLDTRYGIVGRYPFFNSNFQGQHLTFSGGSINNLYGIKLSENTNLIIEDDVKISTVRFGGAFDSVMINAEKETYLIAKNQAERRGEYSLSGKYLYLEKRAERKQFISLYKQSFRQRTKAAGKIPFYKHLKDIQFYSTCIRFAWNYISEKILGYGEKPGRALASSVLIILLFGFIYFFFNLLNDSHLGRSLFFSIVTFTTVGYGNNYPKDGAGEIFSAIEMLLGVTFIAMWTATIVRKMMR